MTDKLIDSIADYIWKNIQPGAPGVSRSSIADLIKGAIYPSGIWLTGSKKFIASVLEVSEHLHSGNGELTATEQYDLAEQLYTSVREYEASLPKREEIYAVDSHIERRILTEGLQEIRVANYTDKAIRFTISPP